MGNTEDKQKNFWEKFTKSIFAKRYFRKVLEIVFPIAISVSVGFITTKLAITLSVGIPCFIIYIVAIVFYSLYDGFLEKRTETNNNKIKNLIETNQSIQEEKEACEKTLLAIKAVLETATSNLENLLETIKNNRMSKEINDIWSYKQTSSIICRRLLTVLTANCPAETIEVSYITKYENKKSICPIAYENTEHEEPNILNKEYAVKKSNKLANKYLFEKIFMKGSKDPTVILEKKEIQKNFYFGTQAKREQCKYDQYIAVPLYNESADIIGLLQIAIVKPIKEMSEKNWRYIITALVKPLSYLIILAQKIQMCIDFIVKGDKSNNGNN